MTNGTDKESWNSGNNDYLQEQFRRQAQKRIDVTKQRFNSKEPKNFAFMMKEACNQTLKKMQDMGITDTKGNLVKGTQQESDTLFDVYYNAYLQRAKGKFNDPIKSLCEKVK